MEVNTDLYYYQFIKDNPEFTGCVIDKDRDKVWFLNGKEHRKDGPAVEHAKEGTKFWYLNGLQHREEAPAVEWADGTKEWWLNGKLHRTDGPACEYANGTKFWYLNGKLLTEEGWNLEIRLSKLNTFLHDY